MALRSTTHGQDARGGMPDLREKGRSNTHGRAKDARVKDAKDLFQRKGVRAVKAVLDEAYEDSEPSDQPVSRSRYSEESESE